MTRNLWILTCAGQIRQIQWQHVSLDPRFLAFLGAREGTKKRNAFWESILHLECVESKDCVIRGLLLTVCAMLFCIAKRREMEADKLRDFHIVQFGISLLRSQP